MPTPSVLIVPNRLKAGILYSQLPANGDVDFDVTRATTAYRTNSLGILESVASGVPRLDYPIGGGCPALLVEPAATNLFFRSETFDDVYWTKTNTTVTANATTAPDGTLTADKLFATTTGTDRRIQRSNTLAAATYTTSIFIKAAELNTIRMYAVDFSSQATFNLALGTVSNITGGATAKIENYGNGWYRCSITIAYAGGTGVSFYVNLGNAFSGATITAGDGVFLWGAQLEVGSVATSYIPTVAATATRNADVISKTGVSGFIGQTQGTLYAEVDIANPDKSIIRTILGIGDGTVNNRFSIRRDTNGRIIVICVVGSSTIGFVQTGNDQLGVFKIAVAYAVNDLTMYVNGASIGTTTIASVPACSRIDVGKLEGTGTTNQLNDRIRAAAIYTTRLSNTELAQLTSL